MTKILTEESIRHAYDRKVKSCEERGIGFELTLPQYRALIRSRSTMVCFYTGKQFDLRSTDNPAYPSIDRLDDTQPYKVGNIVLCHALVNRIKSEVIESGQGLRKGMEERDIRIARSIQKVLSQPEVIKQRMKPYQEIFDKVAQREQEKESKEMTHKANLEACEKAKRINEAKAKAEEQLALSKHYTMIMTMFEKMGLVYNLSIKQHRDVYRVTRCKISKQPFESMEDKFMWIPNKSAVMEKGMVDKEDFIVTYNNMRDVLDNLASCGNLKTISLNVLKYV